VEPYARPAPEATPPSVGAPAPRLLCDHMLIRLGRWLRAAGLDTAIAGPGRADGELLREALSERRLLVTRDRRLLEFRGAFGVVVLLRANGVAACAAELTARLGVDWLHRPFSRCLECNGPLAPAPGERVAQVPPESGGADVYHCAGCDRIFWAGSHVRRMQATLDAWASSDFR